MISAGRLDKRITIQRPASTQDVNGSEVLTFETVSEVWARVAPVKGREYVNGGSILADMDTRIDVRTAPDFADMDAKWRAVYRGKVYNFVSCAEIGMGGEYIEIMAKSGVNAG